MTTIRSHPFVIPAQAGILAGLGCRRMKIADVPAYAGMTGAL